MGSLTTGLLAIWALAVAAFDLRQRRIPNALLIVVAAPALLALLIYRHGPLGAGVGQSLGGLVVGAMPLLAGYVSGQVAAGDVKLAALQGFLLGTGAMLKALLVAGLALGLMALGARLAGLDRSSGQAADRGNYRLPAAVALVVGFAWVLAHRFLLQGWGI